MKSTLSTSITIIAISFLSFLWMMSGYYQIPFDEFMNPVFETFRDSNTLIIILAMLVGFIIYFAIAIISVLFALFWPLGGIMAIVVLFGGTFLGISGKNKTKYSSDSSSFSENYTYSNTFSSKTNNKKVKKRIIPGKRGEIYNQETGKFEKELGPFYQETGNRIDLETGKYQEETIFGINLDTGKKIDLESGEIYEDSLLGYQKTGTRVNQKTGRIQKDGLFGWEDTKERINSETGKRQEQDWLGVWSDKDN